METNEVIKRLMGELDVKTNVEFARLVNVDGGTVTRWLKSPDEKGARVPKPTSIGPLLGLASPELQVELLQALGVEDPMQFAKELLTGLGVIVIETKDAEQFAREFLGGLEVTALDARPVRLAGD